MTRVAIPRKRNLKNRAKPSTTSILEKAVLSPPPQRARVKPAAITKPATETTASTHFLSKKRSSRITARAKPRRQISGKSKSMFILSA